MQRGFTLIELVMVVVLIALISTLAVTRLDSYVLWQQKGDIRQFVNTWQYLYEQAIGRGDAYRLVIDLDANTYFVRREITVRGTRVRQVDYLKNLRTKSEQERRAKKELEENELSLEEEFREEDIRQSGQLSELFYQTVFNDPYGPNRLGRPLEFPDLAEPRKLTEGLKFRDVKIQNKTFETGQVFVRLSPRGASEFAVVHFQSGESVITAMMNPATGAMSVKDGDVDYEWKLGKTSKS